MLILQTLLMLLLSFLVHPQTSNGTAHFFCVDWTGKKVENGKTYVPDRHDLCKRCNCDHGNSAMCASVSCSPQCNGGFYKQVEGKCCEFVCLDERIPGSGDWNTTGTTYDGDEKNNVTVLGLRLVASSVTSLLILSLLIFMIHRLRQRRLLLSRQRFINAHRCLDEVDANDFIPDPHSINIQIPPYEDPPPPYSPPKPAHIDLPPPYEAVDRNGNVTSIDDQGSAADRGDNAGGDNAGHGNADVCGEGVTSAECCESSNISCESSNASCESSNASCDSSNVSCDFDMTASTNVTVPSRETDIVRSDRGNLNEARRSSDQGGPDVCPRRSVNYEFPASNAQQRVSGEFCAGNRSRLQRTRPDFESKVINGLRMNNEMKSGAAVARRTSMNCSGDQKKNVNSTVNSGTQDNVNFKNRNPKSLHLNLRSVGEVMDNSSGSASDMCDSLSVSCSPNSPTRFLPNSPEHSGSPTAQRLSVCSETGEQKIAGSAIANDVLYPMYSPGVAVSRDRIADHEGDGFNINSHQENNQDGNPGLGDDVINNDRVYPKTLHPDLSNQSERNAAAGRSGEMTGRKSVKNTGKSSETVPSSSRTQLVSPKARSSKNRVILSYISPSRNPKPLHTRPLPETAPRFQTVNVECPGS